VLFRERFLPRGRPHSGQCGTAFTLHEAPAKSYRRGDVPRRLHRYNFYCNFSDLQAATAGFGGAIGASFHKGAAGTIKALQFVPRNNIFERLRDLRLTTEEALKKPMPRSGNCRQIRPNATGTERCSSASRSSLA
jgi:hypothetical protein